LGSRFRHGYEDGCNKSIRGSEPTRQADACVTLLNELSEKFEEALIYATRAHAIRRAENGIPLSRHILGVTAIALEYGANETDAIGGVAS